MSNAEVTRIKAELAAKQQEIEKYDISDDNSDVVKKFHNHLKEAYGEEVVVCGVTLQEPWKILKDNDEDSYNQVFADWTDSYRDDILADLQEYKDLEEEYTNLEMELERAEEQEQLEDEDDEET